MGNPLCMEVLHSLCGETMTVSNLILPEIGSCYMHSSTMLCTCIKACLYFSRIFKRIDLINYVHICVGCV